MQQLQVTQQHQQQWQANALQYYNSCCHQYRQQQAQLQLQQEESGGGALPKKQVKKEGKKQPLPSSATTPTSAAANVSALPPPPSPLPPPQPPSSSLGSDSGVCAHAGIDLGGDDDDAATQASECITACPSALDVKNRVEHQHVTDDARDDDEDNGADAAVNARLSSRFEDDLTKLRKEQQLGLDLEIMLNESSDQVRHEPIYREFQNVLKSQLWDKPMLDGGSVLRRACVLREFDIATRLIEELKVTFDSESDQRWAANSDEARLVFLLASSTHPMLAGSFIDAGTSMICTIHRGYLDQQQEHEYSQDTRDECVTGLQRMCGEDAAPQGQPELIQ